MLTRPVALHFAKTGINQQVATIPWLSSDFADVVAFQMSGAKLGLGFNLGQPWFDNFGNTFNLKIARSALVFGNLTCWNPPTASAENGAGTTRTFIPTSAMLAAGLEKGNFVSDTTLTLDTDRLKLIKDNPTTLLGVVSLLDTKYANFQADQDAYSVAPANADLLSIIRPYETIVFPTANATAGYASGVALGTVSTGDPHFEQTGGLAMINATGGGTALVAGSACVPSGVTAGNVIGAAAPLMNSPGMCAAAYAQGVGKSAPVFLTIWP
jgi:hypothetical protein